MHFIYNGLFLLSAIKWGDWKRWKEFYPTILFFIMGDLLKNFLFFNYSMWTYKETIIGESLLPNHTFISLLIMFIVYPSTILLYLGHFPRAKYKQILWLCLWATLYILVEYINLRYLNLIEHHHGWNMWWSSIFNLIMFSLLRLHYKAPIWAWVFSLLWNLFLWNVFDVPISKLK